MFSDWSSSIAVALGPSKPILAALVLPPMPQIVLLLAGAWLLWRRRRAGWGLVLASAALAWLCACQGFAGALEQALLHPPPPLDAAQRAALRDRAAAGTPTAIVVLGGGVRSQVPEYEADDLGSDSLDRLRYGVWLGRRTGVPVAMSGGTGWVVGGHRQQPEADVGARIAAEEFGSPLRWREDRSSDTHENAVDIVPMLAQAGVREIALVTDRWHMPRALREFRAAAAHEAAPMRIVPAPISDDDDAARPLLRWMPSSHGVRMTSVVLREALGNVFAPRDEAPITESAIGASGRP